MSEEEFTTIMSATTLLWIVAFVALTVLYWKSMQRLRARADSLVQERAELQAVSALLADVKTEADVRKIYYFVEAQAQKHPNQLYWGELKVLLSPKVK